VSKNFAVGNFAWDIYGAPSLLHKKNSNIKVDNLVPCCEFEVQKPTQAHMSVKCPGNSFDISSKWQEISLWEFFMGYLQSPHNFFRISKLIFDILLWA
jgi:hypothetical protein